tara:strand:- start:1317 stop:1646 length:330 start_codon:yes stop_codon:yes gene_type:complete
MDIVKKFSKYLTSVEYPKEKTSWNVAGIIKGQNAFYRFDVRNMFKLSNGTLAQNGKLNTQAQKMVLESNKEWLIFDLEELHKYIRKDKKMKVYINDLIKHLEWTTFLAK